MAQICEVCGLPKEICACTTIEKETARDIKVYSKKQRFNYVTIVEGLQKDELQTAAKELKRKLACGGTSKNGVIILQGEHKRKVKEYLAQLGYPKELIRVS
jgi:translation initiation factor 1